MGRNGRWHQPELLQDAALKGVQMIGAKAPKKIAIIRREILEHLKDVRPQITWDIRIQAHKVKPQPWLWYRFYLMGHKKFSETKEFKLIGQTRPVREDFLDPASVTRAMMNSAQIIWRAYERFVAERTKE